MDLERTAQVLTVLLALMLPAACRRSKNLDNEDGPPVAKELQKQILEASGRLREQWNGGARETLYQQAAAYFRSQPLPDWLNDCEYFRRQLDMWRSLVPQETFSCGAPAVVCLDGKAVFGKGYYDVIIAWTMENRQPRLLYLSLAQGEKGIGTIPSRRDFLLDPPPPSRMRGLG